ncbi:hypothetical protein DEJ51_03965 [Streptomyces venezuelae]|uniref:Uncharacterized protein n=1 Tax=Streptomyces venezuelae TaxID=54571 RepID=A0A5P2DEB3_STRVZ|nr:hypothetical protein [Streptomyces venezuelae]QES53504.1 hypothetical protein DEJ51_03965 [Streptomyces venezuelae]
MTNERAATGRAGADGIPLPLPPGTSWYATGSGVFPHAARVGGRWWVLRLNDFPEHPLLTLFVDGRRVADLDHLPSGRRRPEDAPAPVLAAPERAGILDLMARLGPYGAEYGTPCAGDWCTCDLLTETYVRERAG